MNRLMPCVYISLVCGAIFGDCGSCCLLWTLRGKDMNKELEFYLLLNSEEGKHFLGIISKIERRSYLRERTIEDYRKGKIDRAEFMKRMPS